MSTNKRNERLRVLVKSCNRDVDIIEVRESRKHDGSVRSVLALLLIFIIFYVAYSFCTKLVLS